MDLRLHARRPNNIHVPALNMHRAIETGSDISNENSSVNTIMAKTKKALKPSKKFPVQDAPNQATTLADL